MFWGTLAGTDSAGPNILLILADDLGHNDVGFNESTEIVTPHLDQLAADGTTFSSPYVAHPFCGPIRAALMTGRTLREIGSQFNLPENDAIRDEGTDVNGRFAAAVRASPGVSTT